MSTLAMTAYVAFVLCGWAGYLDYFDPVDVWPSALAVNLLSRLAVPALCLPVLAGLGSERRYRMFGVFLALCCCSAVVSLVLLGLAMAGLPASYPWLVSKGVANASAALLCYCYYAYQAEDGRNLRIALTFVLGVALFFAMGALPDPAVRALTVATLPLVACVCCLPFVRRTLRSEARECHLPAALEEDSAPVGEAPSTVLRRRRVRFYLSRIAWGVLSGASIALMAASPEGFTAVPTTSVLLACAALLVLFAGGVALVPGLWSRACASSAVQLGSAVALPLAVTGLLLVPYMLAGDGTIPKVVFFAASLAWMLQAFFRLSEWTCLLGLDAPLLVVSEDLVMRGARYVAEGIVRTVLLAGGPASDFVLRNLVGLEFLVGFGSVAAATVCIASFMARWYGFGQPRGSQAKAAWAAERYGFTPREVQALELLLEGMSRAQMCERMGISINTVNTHVRRIYDKASVHSRRELVDALSADEGPGGQSEI